MKGVCMPGFFDFMSRMVEGKPVFDDDKPNDDGSDQVPAQSVKNDDKPTIRKGNDNSFPVVYIKRVTPHVHGTSLQVYCQIVNTWPEEIMLDKIRMLGAVRELDSFIRGNHEEEFLVYDGPMPSHEYHEALLHYKTQQEGDYFEALHDVTFTYHPDTKLYSVNEMHLRKPIRDIYG